LDNLREFDKIFQKCAGPDCVGLCESRQEAGFCFKCYVERHWEVVSQKIKSKCYFEKSPWDSDGEELRRANVDTRSPMSSWPSEKMTAVPARVRRVETKEADIIDT
jgi:hypothetical protein